MLRVYDYVADAKGYRIVRTRAIKLGRKRKRKKKLLDHQRENDLDNVIEPLRTTERPFEVTKATFGPPTPPPTRHPRLQRRIGGGGGRTDMPPSYPPANPPSYQQVNNKMALKTEFLMQVWKIRL